MENQSRGLGNERLQCRERKGKSKKKIKVTVHIPRNLRATILLDVKNSKNN